MAENAFVRIRITTTRYAPERISEIVGMVPDFLWYVGGARCKSDIRERTHGWVVDSGLSSHEPLEKHLDAVLARIASYQAGFQRLGSDVDVQLSIALYADEPPALPFERQFIERLAAIGAALDVDLYYASLPDERG